MAELPALPSRACAASTASTGADPEGDAFGRAARRFEEMGVGALAINCIPPDHVTGMLSWLRDFTDLPLGVYPNLGYLSAVGGATRRASAGSRTPSWR